MKKKLLQLLKDPFIISLIVIVMAGIFLRFFRFEGFVTFLGDQGRDALIMKRIVTLEHIPGVGAPSSIGQVFLGPFYYYLMAPWMLLSKLDPIGPAIGVAIFSSIFIVVAYFGALHLFNRKETALIFSTLISFSYIMIWLSRFSWNPNLLPLFSFLAVYFFVRALEDKKIFYFISSGLFFSFCLQFHYVALASGIPVVGFLAYYLYSQKKNIKQPVLNVISMVAALLVGNAPLIIFDVRNDFINLKSFIKLLTGNEVVSNSHGLSEIVHTFSAFNNHAFHISAPFMLNTFIFFLLISCIPFLYKEKKNFKYVGIFFFVTLLFTSYFTSNKHQHYFGFLYPLYYLYLAIVVDMVFAKGRWLIITIFLLGFIGFQAKDYTFLHKPGSYQIRIAEKIAREIDKHITNKSYYVTSLPESVGDSTERYFLEKWGRKSMEKNTTERAEELIVLCEEKCSPVGNGQYDIALFAPKKIVGTWKVENVTIYKLTR